MGDMTSELSFAPGVAGVLDRPTADHRNGAQFSELLQGVIETTALRPAAQGSAITEVELLTGAASGPVGEARTDLVSQIDRPENAQQGGEEVADGALQAATEARMRTLYLDLTNYQIAWRIAQRMQQDISQLLRGM